MKANRLLHRDHVSIYHVINPGLAASQIVSLDQMRLLEHDSK